jgi:chitodextrinase
MILNKIRNTTRSLIALLAISLVLALPGWAMAAEETVVSVTTPGQVEPGEQFVVNVVVEPGAEIAGVQFDLAFDPSLVTIDSVAEGNLLSQGGATTYFSSGSIDNVSGNIGGVAGAIITPGQTVSATGTFAVITVTAGPEEGTCPFTLSGVIAGDINGQPVVVNTVDSQIIINTNAPASGGGGGGGGPDTSPPRFSNIAVSAIGKTSATISWATQEKGTSQVEYWASPHQFSPLDETMVRSHVVQLTELMPATTYHYRVISRDAAGNLAVSDEYQFVTSGKPADMAVNALSVTPREVHVGEEVLISVSVTNNGDAASSHQLVLKIDESVAETREISLDGGTTQEVAFRVTMTTAGIRSIDVNGLTGDITVVAKSEATANFIIDPRYNADTGRLSYVSITYEVNNPAEQLVHSDAILNVELDSQLVDSIVLTPDGGLESGITSGNLNYSPGEGWKIGTYTFYIGLYEDGNFLHGTAGQNLDVTAEQATSSMSWSVLAIIIGIALATSTIAIFFVVRLRRRML